MKTEEQMDFRPEAVTYEESPELVSVLIRTNIQEHSRDEESPYYTCDLTRLTLDKKELTDELKRAIELAPEKFINYIPVRNRTQVQIKYTNTVQAWMDTEVQTHGYDDIKSAVGYVGDPDPQFAAEGAACQSWRSRVWRACYAYLDDVLAGKKDIIPVEELIEKLPQMQWPNADSE